MSGNGGYSILKCGTCKRDLVWVGEQLTHYDLTPLCGSKAAIDGEA